MNIESGKLEEREIETENLKEKKSKETGRIEVHKKVEEYEIILQKNNKEHGKRIETLHSEFNENIAVPAYHSIDMIIL